MFDQRERFYIVRVPLTQIRTDGWEELERQYMERERWWTLPEIAGSDALFVPRRLAELLPPIIAGHYPPEPFDCGV
jgi:hypothetical protein